jgi:hypothetical protein
MLPMESDRFIFATVGTVALVAFLVWALHALVAAMLAGVLGPELAGLMALIVYE